MISQIEAHHYRCFPELAIGLARYYGLVGASGAVKSSLLDVQVLTPKDTLDHLARPRVRVLNADFGSSPAGMFVESWRDPAFNQRSDQLRVWLPEQW